MKLTLLLSIFYTSINGILGFIVTNKFAENLGQNNLGIFKLFSQILSYLNLAELGIGIAIIASLYQPIKSNNYNEINQILFTAKQFYRRIFFIILILGLLISIFIPQLGSSNYNLKLIWIIFVINSSITYLFAIHPLYLTADQNYHTVQSIKSIIKALLLISQIFILTKYKNFYYFSLIQIFYTITEFIIYLAISKSYGIPKVYKSSLHKSLIKNTKQVFIHKISSLLVFNTDYLLISIFLGVSIIASYSSYLMVIQILLLFITNFTSVIKPKVGILICNSKLNDILINWKKLSIAYAGIATIFSSVFYLTCNEFILFWLGKDYILNSYTIFLLSINLYFSIFRIPIDIIKECLQIFSDIHLAIFEGILNLALSIILIFLLGLPGVILGTVISNIMIVIILKTKFVFNKLNIPSSNYKLIIYLLITSTLAFFIICTFPYHINLNEHTIYSISLFIFSTFIIATIIVTIIFMVFIKCIKNQKKSNLAS